MTFWCLLVPFECLLVPSESRQSMAPTQADGATRCEGQVALW
jgi:hypothetical protein